LIATTQRAATRYTSTTAPTQTTCKTEQQMERKHGDASPQITKQQYGKDTQQETSPRGSWPASME
jgi:hypothetical protein